MIRITLRSMLLLAALGIAGLAASARADNPANCDAGCKVCCPVTEMKKVTKRVYSDTCEDFCLPRSSFLGGLFHKDCAECKEASCGKVRTKKYLVVKIRTHEECITKCVPTPSGAAPAPAAVPLPVKP